jgi:type IV pilus assembly protein PilV
MFQFIEPAMIERSDIFMNSRTFSAADGPQGGFSMIEVLVTMLIISLALLGTMGLQAYALRVNQGGQFRSQAVFLVADLAERMEANRSAAVTANNGYIVATPSNTTQTASVKCTAACTKEELAALDMDRWTNLVASTLPQSMWTVTQTVSGNPSTYTINVSWVDREENITYGSGASKGASGTGEKMSYTATRTILSPSDSPFTP